MVPAANLQQRTCQGVVPDENHEPNGSVTYSDWRSSAHSVADNCWGVKVFLETRAAQKSRTGFVRLLSLWCGGHSMWMVSGGRC